MESKPSLKYRPLTGPQLTDRQWPDRHIEQVPIWCSVDLRDGNQALSEPMDLHKKREFFQLLIKMGFREIEVGFPSASQIEFDFVRSLIKENLIPENVTIQVLTQSKEALIRRTFESLKGAKNAIVHLYNSTSTLQRKVTFQNASREKIKGIAQEGTTLIKSLAEENQDTRFRFQYSPESFSDTEPEFALEVCEAVSAIWQPTEKEPIILNLPATVEYFGPNHYADQIEWFCKNLQVRSEAIISLHTHNDRGCGTAATELGLLAGADRVEGTLFGNGERTGNLDINIVALNLYTHGLHPGLDYSDMPHIRSVYEKCTGMKVPDRHPYAGDLVFTAFSGSHQDAIKKGMDQREQKSNCQQWEVPYLSIDPQDIGRNYEAIIRINSQSGKGGVAYLLQKNHGIDLPKNLRPEVGSLINTYADREKRELLAGEIYHIFREEFLNLQDPLSLRHYSVEENQVDAESPVSIKASVHFQGKEEALLGKGNGPINAFVSALQRKGWKDFILEDYRQHSISKGSASASIAYICIKKIHNQALVWGAATHTNIEKAGLLALVSAFNRALAE